MKLLREGMNDGAVGMSRLVVIVLLQSASLRHPSPSSQGPI